jgi:uncharacterized phage-associated protein
VGAVIDAALEYPSLHVASYIVNLCEQDGVVYNPTKVQKLLYCCYGAALAAFGRRLCDERPRAWQYGPVFPRVFNYLHKGQDIAALCPKLAAPEAVLSLIGDTVKVFGAYSASALSKWSHMDGSPWSYVINELHDRNGVIPDDLISDYFARNVLVVKDA